MSSTKAQIAPFPVGYKLAWSSTSVGLPATPLGAQMLSSPSEWPQTTRPVHKVG